MEENKSKKRNNKNEGAHSLGDGAPLYFCGKFVIVMNGPFLLEKEMREK